VKFLLAAAVLARAWAQTSDASPPESAGLLEQIKQRATEDLARVPNYVCVDSIERSLWIPGEHEFRLLDRVHAELAHVEGADKFSWIGNSAFQSRNPTAMVGYGAGFGGDFSDNRTLVFKNRQTKMSYASPVTIAGRPALRFEFDHPRGALGVANGNQSGWTAARGSFWIDPQTLDLLQLDVEGYAIPSNLAVRSIADSTTYWRVLIGRQIVLLPRNSEFRLAYADGTGRRNASVFSNCREYTADSTLTFAQSPAPQPPPPTVEDLHVQPGLQLQLVLDKTLDAKEASVGDPVRAHVLKGDVGVRRGAHVYGRVNRIINFDDLIPLPRPKHPPPTPKHEHEILRQHPGEVLIQIEFFQIEYRRGRASLVGRLIDLESQPGRRATNIRSFGYLDDDAAVKYDPPGTASIYVSKDNPVLGRDVVLLWVTASGHGSL
jgi:hypothetical protein